MPAPVPGPDLIERAKTFPFILHWYLWRGRFQDDFSRQANKGFGYRAGVFFPGGARYGQHHDDWPPFFDVLAAMGLTMLSIEALFCYETYRSCQVFIDTLGAEYIPP